MAIEARYAFKKFRPCRWEDGGGQVFKSGELANFGVFRPASVEAISDGEERFGNVFVDQKDKPMWGRMIDPDGSDRAITLRYPIVLEPGQTLQLWDRTRSLSLTFGQ